MMARMVKHEGMGPIKIDPNAEGEGAWPRDDHGNLKPVFVCSCGISSKFPFCDGSHKQCKAEVTGKVYTYDPVTKQVTSEGA
ncbi:MAG: CDGSH iron-sulfur domain-containing protein [Phycisphaerales bacterium]